MDTFFFSTSSYIKTSSHKSKDLYEYVFKSLFVPKKLKLQNNFNHIEI